MSILPVCRYVHPSACNTHRVHKTEGVRTFGTAVTDGCELPSECWELKPGPLKE